MSQRDARLKGRAAGINGWMEKYLARIPGSQSDPIADAVNPHITDSVFAELGDSSSC